jgi:hypothetical protein
MMPVDAIVAKLQASPPEQITVEDIQKLTQARKDQIGFLNELLRKTRFRVEQVR